MGQSKGPRQAPPVLMPPVQAPGVQTLPEQLLPAHSENIPEPAPTPPTHVSAPKPAVGLSGQSPGTLHAFPFPGRSILKDRQLVDEPFVGMVEKGAGGLVPSPG